MRTREFRRIGAEIATFQAAFRFYGPWNSWHLRRFLSESEVAFEMQQVAVDHMGSPMATVLAISFP